MRSARLITLFDQLNQFSISMQGRNNTVLVVLDKTEGSKKKSVLFGTEGWWGINLAFSFLSEILIMSTHPKAFDSVCRLLPRLLITWRLLDFEPVLCGSGLRSHGSIHYVTQVANNAYLGESWFFVVTGLKIKGKEQTDSNFECYFVCQPLTHFTIT